MRQTIDYVSDSVRTGRKAESAGSSRLLFVDNIRWVLIVLVICHHAAVTYSHIGGWYFMDGPKPDMITSLLFATFETFNQAFFMGILFLLAGYFVPLAFDAKGPKRFLADRATRLGIPSLMFMLVLHPITIYLLLGKSDELSAKFLSRQYLRFIFTGEVFRSTGPMWFAVALLLFCCAYAAVRASTTTQSIRFAIPNYKSATALILIMGTCTFLVRIWQPIGVNVMNMQLCYFSQYILLFCVGIYAYRGDWLRQIPHAFGTLWMKLALMIGMPAWFLIVLTSGALQGDTQSLLGGFHWQSAAFSFWESFVCVGMCLGLIVLFRQRFNHQAPFSRWMSRNSFSAYLFHTPLLVAVTLVLHQLDAPAEVKFILASLITVPITFLVSSFLRPRIPVLRRIL